MAIYSNLTMDQGSNFQATIEVNDSSGNNLNLTGYSVAGQMRKSYASSTATDFTASNGTDIRIAHSSVTLENNDSVEIIGTKLDSSNILLEQSSVSISGGSIGGDTAINVKNIESDVFFNHDTFTDNLTVSANKNAMIIGPVNFTGNLTINGNLSIV